MPTSCIFFETIQANYNAGECILVFKGLRVSPIVSDLLYGDHPKGVIPFYSIISITVSLPLSHSCGRLQWASRVWFSSTITLTKAQGHTTTSTKPFIKGDVAEPLSHPTKSCPPSPPPQSLCLVLWRLTACCSIMMLLWGWWCWVYFLRRNR